MWLGLLLVGSVHARAPAPDDADGQAFARVLERMHAVVTGLRDCTFTLYKQEWVDGAMGSLSVADVDPDTYGL